MDTRKIRGAALNNDLAYIRQQEGEKRTNELIRKIREERDSNFDPGKINGMSWYPLEWQEYLLLETKKQLQWQEKDIFQMGYHAPQYSILLKIFLRYFLGTESALRNSNRSWRQHYNIGRVSRHKIDKKKKQIFFKIEDFYVDPVLCPLLQGALSFFASMATGKEIKVKEAQCELKEKGYCEIVLVW